MKIIFNNLQREEILEYLREITYPIRVDTKSKKIEFSKSASRFAICSQSNLLKFKLGMDRYVLFFISEEEHFRKAFITLQHVNNEHAVGYALTSTKDSCLLNNKRVITVYYRFLQYMSIAKRNGNRANIK
ncbi:hypothetical protein DMUE_5026 [Dictyocoela muelleri]|nr:hypothetical protein DMUE_5026 [Dictyocoela muelleri]